MLKVINAMVSRLNAYLYSLYAAYFATEQKVIHRIWKVSSPTFKRVMTEAKLEATVQAYYTGSRESLAKVYAEIANLLVNAGQQELAVFYFEKSLKCKIDRCVSSQKLQSLVLSPISNDARIMKESVKCSKLYYHFNKKYFKKGIHFERKKPKKLKIAYICHFFHNSVAQSIIIPFIKAHDRSKVEVYCYFDWDKSSLDDGVRGIADHWRDTDGMSDDDFVKLVRRDGIHVVIEMNGHTVVNRYQACVDRMAPVQISFYNFAATSGVVGLDYIIVDNKVLKTSEEKYFTEKIYRLPNAYGVANFNDSFPEVASCPYDRNGYITFGSFGAAHKMNEYTIALWCKVLHLVPRSRFFMKAGALTHIFYQDAFYQYFADNGIGRDRLIFEGWSPHHEMLEKYAMVDIALDSYPYHAGTTTLEAIWQGVPVLSLSGDRLAARTSISILTNLGHPEFVGHSEAEFLSIAKALAENHDRRRSLRQQLREDFRQSVLYDAALFASDLEDAYYAMWYEWLAADKGKQSTIVQTQ